MDPEVREELKTIRALAEDNHRMLRALRRAQLWSFAGKVIFWAVIILVPLYFLEPYLKVIPSGQELQSLINQYQHPATTTP